MDSPNLKDITDINQGLSINGDGMSHSRISLLTSPAQHISPRNSNPDCDDKTANEQLGRLALAETQAPLKNNAKYTYSSLDASKREIRLLKFQKSIGTDCRISCTVVTVLLSDAPEYHAISYAWGDSTDKVDIAVDGKILAVTRNLESHLWWWTEIENQPPLLWADGISINQEDLEERSHQVSFMRAIYERATVVDIWLYGPLEDSQGMELIQTFWHQERETKQRLFATKTQKLKRSLKKPWSSILPNFVIHGSDGTGSASNILPSSPSLEHLAQAVQLRHIDSLLRLVNNDYWHRIWVIQETVSAKEKLIHWGPNTITWVELNDFQKQVQQKTKLMAEFCPDVPIAGKAFIFNLGPKLLLLPSSQTSSQLGDLLIHYKYFVMSDPRDSVYALVGLSSAKDDPNFVIDYSLSAEQVFTNTVKYILEPTQTLDIICLPTKRSHPDKQASWVPRFEARQPSYTFRYLQASKGQKAEIRFMNQILVAKGICIDDVQNVGEKVRMKNSKDIPAMLLMFHSWRRLLDSNKDDKLQAFCRTLLNGLDRKSEGRESMNRKILKMVTEESVKEGISLEDDYHSATSSYEGVIEELRLPVLHSLAYNTFRANFFISKTKTIGLGPDETLPGDKICILFGCKYPVILRPIGDGYHLIGPAYVDKYSEGEAIEAWEKGLFTAENFEIH